MMDETTQRIIEHLRDIDKAISELSVVDAAEPELYKAKSIALLALVQAKK